MDAKMKARIMTGNRMRAKRKVIVSNPRYIGATPQMVGKALLMQRPKPAQKKPPSDK